MCQIIPTVCDVRMVDAVKIGLSRTIFELCHHAHIRFFFACNILLPSKSIEIAKMRTNHLFCAVYKVEANAPSASPAFGLPDLTLCYTVKFAANHPRPTEFIGLVSLQC